MTKNSKLGKKKVQYRRNILSIIKAIYNNATVNIVLSGEKLKSFPLRSGTGIESYFLPFLFNRVLEILPRVISQET